VGAFSDGGAGGGPFGGTRERGGVCREGLLGKGRVT